MGRERPLNLNTPMDNINIPAWAAKALYAVGIAAVLGGGGTVLQSAKDIAVLQRADATNTSRLERIEDKTDRILERLK